ncbi:OmpH family outer membrane protein [Vogesella sp. LIG4]|uniref:OmpH family outer membrane protein n=1 Tax=Vogesella sp. LIG4 TaxID=1192162 RepID=UPI00081F7823|nr:OmpH family outer membrane protein [Vogesella sp. LIG4]SCK23966.1 periplasmic chaperone for outer membrane proteins Skp [Vogesella sp. LIG4]
MKAFVSMAAMLGTLATAGLAQAADLKIGYINTERVYREAAPAVVAQKKLEKEFATREQELKKLAARGKELEGTIARNKANETERKAQERELAAVDREYQAKMRDFRDDLNQRRNEEFASVQERANRIIRQIAEREQFDLILQDAVYVSPKLDITPRVLKELEK